MVASLVERHVGIRMAPTKKTMIAARLQRRLRALQMPSYGAYLGYLDTPEGARSELRHFHDLITTHKTEFFREPEHFEVLTQVCLPELVARRGAAPHVSVWSAGCSTGQEVYTLAMVLSAEAERRPSSPSRFSILGTDVSSVCIEKAEAAIYGELEIEGIPLDFRKKYLLRSRDPSARRFRFVPALRARTRFLCLNFMNQHWNTGEMDVIFFRNVLIYFQPDVQQDLLRRLAGRLKPGGYLFIGHSETVTGMDLPLTLVGRSVLQRTDGPSE